MTSTPLQSIYRELVLEHSRAPRNKVPMAHASHSVRRSNPVCGDDVTLQVAVREGVLSEAAFQGNGCSISMASASMLSEALNGVTVEVARSLSGEVRALVDGRAEPTEALGDLSALAGVADVSTRHQCALLPFDCLDRVIAEIDGTGSDAEEVA